jgi:hypothetical protein
MEKHTTLNNPEYMYNGYDYDPTNTYDVNNRLFATFTDLDTLDDLIENITKSYSIMYKKMFVLYVKSTDEYVVTYNVEQGNINTIPENTILVHRKKESNTLYSLNALNEVIKRLNGGVVDSSYRVNWQHYKNCILLTNHNELKQLNTKIYKIVEI